MDIGLIAAGAVVVAVLVFLQILIALSFRVVVKTNEVHIVQSGKQTQSYGKDMGSNTYYKWPSWLPRIGVKVTVLPLSVFRVELVDYSAYDKGRLPFILDVLAFFRISDPNKAAERISTIEELDGQLQGIMQGVVRTILAQSEIESILGERAVFSDKFTKEVQEQLPQWGIETVKNIELMDVRDEAGGKVIANIMAKKKSEIEKESRVAVAANQQAAAIAEVQADREVQMNKQQAEEQIGIRTAERVQATGIADQKAAQAVKVEEAVTAQKGVDVKKVTDVGAADIAKAVKLVEASRAKETSIIEAEGQQRTTIIKAEADKQQQTLTAEGRLNATKLGAEGIQAEGEAKAKAETLILLAPVTAQTELAQKIGENKGYQEYLLGIETIKANRDVGIEQAKALERADVKVIAQTGGVPEGMKSVMDLVSAKGGTQLAALLEAIRQSPTAEAIMSRIDNAANGKPNGATHAR